VTRKLKPVEVKVSDEIQDAVLNLPVENGSGEITTVGRLVEVASTALRKANLAIEDNALIRLTAQHLMKSGKRRGTPRIQVRLDGSVCLNVFYSDSEEEEPKPLPSITELRAMAGKLGVDISDLGRKKIKILARLKASQAP